MVAVDLPCEDESPGLSLHIRLPAAVEKAAPAPERVRAAAEIR